MRRVLLLGGILLAGSLICRADNIVTFNFQGAISNGYGDTTAAGSATGTVTIDTTTGLVTALDISASTTSANAIGASSETFTSISSQAGAGDFYSVTSDATDMVESDFVDLDFPVESLIGYAGGGLCSYEAICHGGSIGGVYSNSVGGVAFLSASLTPETAATPEPSSLALLGSGALGLAGMLRRRRCC